MDKQDIQRIKSLILVMLICCMPVFCGCNDEDDCEEDPGKEAFDPRGPLCKRLVQVLKMWV